MSFKTRRDAKLTRQRLQEEKQAKADCERRHKKQVRKSSAKTGSKTARVHTAAERDRFFEQLNKERLKKSKGLAHVTDPSEETKRESQTSAITSRSGQDPNRDKTFNGYFSRSKSLQQKRKNADLNTNQMDQNSAEEER